MTALWGPQNSGQVTKRCIAVTRWATYQDVKSRFPWEAVTGQWLWAVARNFVFPYMTTREVSDENIVGEQCFSFSRHQMYGLVCSPLRMETKKDAEKTALPFSVFLSMGLGNVASRPCNR